MSFLSFQRRLGAGRILVLSAVGVQIAACASILGIDTERDPVGDYPSGGYLGCRGNDCDGCITEEHTLACQQARSNTPDAGGVEAKPPGDAGILGGVCDSVAATEACPACVCDNCAEALESCASDEACSAIFDCITEHGCAPGGTGSNGCYRAATCKTAIDAGGGLFEAPHLAAASLLGCITAASCPCGEPSPGQDCNSDEGACDGCATACERCLCARGPGDASCRLFCQDAPCSPDNNDCGTCNSTCSECLCETDGDAAQCEAECLPDVACNSDFECIGCDSELGQCSCESGEYGACLENVGYLDCANPVDFYEECVCGGGATECLSEFGLSCVDSFDPGDWQACACEYCPLQLVECKYDAVCFVDLMPCMPDPLLSGCQDTLNAARDSADLSFDFAEALAQCAYDNGCPPPPEDTLPHGEVCAPGNPAALICDGLYYDEGFVAPGCCVDEGECGVETSTFLPGQVTDCQPFDQRGVVTSACESVPANFPPYPPDYVLSGCCRADGTCGIYEDVLGLGCVAAEVFGFRDSVPCGG